LRRRMASSALERKMEKFASDYADEAEKTERRAAVIRKVLLGNSGKQRAHRRRQPAHARRKR